MYNIKLGSDFVLKMVQEVIATVFHTSNSVQRDIKWRRPTNFFYGAWKCGQNVLLWCPLGNGRNTELLLISVSRHEIPLISVTDYLKPWKAYAFRSRIHSRSITFGNKKHNCVLKLYIYHVNIAAVINTRTGKYHSGNRFSTGQRSASNGKLQRTISCTRSPCGTSRAYPSTTSWAHSGTRARGEWKYYFRSLTN